MKTFITQIKQKTVLVSIAAATGISVIPLSAIASSEPTVVSSSTSSSVKNATAAVTGALKDISNTIQAAAMATANKADALLYQMDSSLSASMQAAPVAQSAAETASETTQSETQSQVKNALWAFPETIVTPDTSTQDGSEMKTNMNDRNNLYNNLTINAPASDTLYIDNSSLEGNSDYSSVVKPSVVNDNYFNFDTLFTPAAYETNADITAAQHYVQFAGALYEPLTTGINYDALKSNLSNYSSATDKANYLKTIVENPVYQNYQLSIRSLVADRSQAASNLNYLLTERTAVADLGKNAGMPDDPKLPSGYASPLQVQQYVATHRVGDPDWYSEVKHASPATLQRMQVTMAAETEALMERNYELNERILSTLSIMSLQANTMQKMTIASQATDVNNLINPQDDTTTTEDSSTDSTDSST